MKKVEVSSNLAPMVTRTARQWCFSVSSSGTRAVVFSARTFWKDGVSSTAFRIHSPRPTSSTESRNGIRQP